MPGKFKINVEYNINCRDERMADGMLYGTFYCPEKPVTGRNVKIDLTLDQKQTKIFDEVMESTEIHILEATLKALDERVTYALDVFSLDSTVVVAKDPNLIRESKFSSVDTTRFNSSSFLITSQ